jgi:hypothetical protein
MAVKKEQLARNEPAHGRKPIELIISNGFSIVRKCDLDGTKALATGKHGFVVRDPRNYELEVTVEIDSKAVTEITMRSRGRLSPDSSYWVACAERHLADYLWEHDKYPPNSRLVVTQPSPIDCDLALRWERTPGSMRNLVGVLLLLYVLTPCFNIAEAQQTVFNEPTADVMVDVKANVTNELTGVYEILLTFTLFFALPNLSCAHKPSNLHSSSRERF